MLPRSEREQELARISELLEVEAPRDRMLTWEQAREMQAAGVEFGAHTYSHSLLSLQTPDEARWEMERTLEDLRFKLGVANPSFAFPGGSYDAALVDLARALGFRSVFQKNRRLRVNSLETTNQFALSRVGLPNAPAHVLEAELDGPFHFLRGLYRA
jgi:peptidoglycan/xylan/chitin deacetylase (PgdA/CDA1 family)